MIKWIEEKPLANQIWQGKYGGDPESVFKFMTKEVFSCLGEEEKDEICAALDIDGLEETMMRIFCERKGLPGGRILAYFASKWLGEANKLTPMNCFVLPIREDSMEAIKDFDKEMALTFKAGGGVGTTVSGLRPNGSKVHNAAKTSTGPVSFLPMFGATVDAVGQNNRRGASLFGMSVYHPDILEFIQAKINGGLESMNISVMVDGRFMEAEEDEIIDLWFPEKTGETFSQPKEVEFIADCYKYPWADGFQVQGENFHRSPTIYKSVPKKDIWDKIVECAWKCGDPGLLFWDRVLEDGDHIHSTNPCQPKGSILIDKNEFKKIESEGELWESWKTGIKEVFKIKTNIGQEIEVTGDHLLQRKNKDWVEAKNSLNKILRHPKEIAPDFEPDIIEDEVMKGFLFGDGFITGGRYGISVKLNIYNEIDVFALLSKYGFHLLSDGITLYHNKNKFPYDVSFLEKRTFNRELPEYITTGDFDTVCSFLRGLFEANGSAKTNGQISLKGTNKKAILQIQTILLSFGIHCAVSPNPPKQIKWPNGIYESKESYNLQIPKSSAKRFKKLIGFISDYKNEKIQTSSSIDKTYIKVTDIRYLGEKEVWDYRMKSGPNYTICQGLILHNCGEEPLPAGGSCNLGAINAAAHKADYLTLNDEEFKRNIRVFVVFLDCLVTYCVENDLYPLPIQKKTAEKYRQIGLGLTGIADYFILNGARYGDEASKTLLNDMMQVKRKEEVRASSVLAQVLDGREGMRNSQVSTIAPTGSISMVLGCSSGIEPNFSFSYEKKVNGKYVEVKSDVEADPSVMVTAHDVGWKDRVEIQAIAQEYTDGAISSTINLRKEATTQEISQIYQAAWESRLKGVTVYRDGSKGDGALRQKPTKKEREILQGKTIKVPLEKSWYITVNFDEDLPTEVFINAGKSGSDTKAWTEAIGRLSSLYLQAGGRAEALVNSLSDIKGSQTIFRNSWVIQSGPDAIAQAISALTHAQGEMEECPKCGEMGLVFSEGCGVCLKCGFEKC